MRVRRLLQGQYTVLATCDGRDLCTLTEFLTGLAPNLEKDSAHMLELLERVAQQGPPRNTEVCHKIDGPIWEFIKGRLRVFWFYDEGQVVVCTHGLIKKTQKIPAAEIKQAQATYERYVAAKKQGKLLIEEEE